MCALSDLNRNSAHNRACLRSGAAIIECDLKILPAHATSEEMTYRLGTLDAKGLKTRVRRNPSMAFLRGGGKGRALKGTPFTRALRAVNTKKKGRKGLTSRRTGRAPFAQNERGSGRV